MENAMHSMVFQWWLPMVAGAIGGVLGCWFMWDTLEVRRHIKRLRGDTRRDTLRNIRAQIETMRREYRLKPGDRFSFELYEMCDKLEETLDRVEREEYRLARVS